MFQQEVQTIITVVVLVASVFLLWGVASIADHTGKMRRELHAIRQLLESRDDRNHGK
jgi:hypothetical protein